MAGMAMRALMLWALSGGGLFGTGQCQAQTYDMNDAGLVLDLPGWEAAGWSDWDFRGTHRDGPVAISVWYTAWQPEITEEAIRTNAVHLTRRIESLEHAKNARVEELKIGEVSGRPTGLLTIRFNFDRVGAPGILYGASFAADGKMIHVAVYGPAAADAKIRAARTRVLSTLKQTKPPAATSAEPLTAPWGSVPLPPGWRAPLPAEAKDLAELTKSTGEVHPEQCAQAVRPEPPDGAALLLLCSRDWHFGVLDEASFPTLEPSFRAKLYGKGAEKVQPGRLYPLPDRTAVIFSPNLSGHTLRTALVPYADQILDVKLIGPAGSGEAVEASLQKVISGIAWSGPDKGAPVYTAGETLMHGMSYNPFHPLKLICVGIGLVSVAGIARRVLKGRDGGEAV